MVVHHLALLYSTRRSLGLKLVGYGDVWRGETKQGGGILKNAHFQEERGFGLLLPMRCGYGATPSRNALLH